MLSSVLLSTSLLAPSSSPGAALAADGEPELDRHHLTVHVERKHVEVRSRIDYVARAEEEAEVSFYLPKELVFSEVSAEGLVGHRFESDGSFVSEVDHALSLRFDPPLKAGERRTIELAYSGSIPDAFEGTWVEFFADCSFAPMHTSFTRSPRYECELRIHEPGYQVFGFGEVEKKDDHWILRSGREIGDVPFVALPELEISEHASGPHEVQIAHVGVDEDSLEGLVEDAAWILSYYNETFGIDQPQHRLRFVIRPTERSLGYARPGYIVLSGDALQPSDRPALGPGANTGHFSFIAHEIGHLWWCRGDPSGFENWLNESFAEYSSMLALRERHGVRPFQRDLATKRQVSRDLPPIVGLERTHPQSFLVFYRKGPLVLDQLRLSLGDGEFNELLISMLSEEVQTTEGLLNLVEDLYGEERAAELRAAVSS